VVETVAKSYGGKGREANESPPKRQKVFVENEMKRLYTSVSLSLTLTLWLCVSAYLPLSLLPL
jgi:hypothetical protein